MIRRKFISLHKTASSERPVRPTNSEAPTLNRPDHLESTTVDEQKAPSLVQIYFSTHSWFERAISAARVGFVGLWLGVLSPKRLYSVVEEYYSRSGRERAFQGFPDYHSKEYNRGGLFGWEQDALTRYFKDCRRLLVLGAGGGREVLALLRLGYQVDGFESHPGLVVAANELLREEGFDPAVHWVAPNEGPETGTTYDGIVVGWGMYMSIPTRRRRISFLRQLRTQTRVRGPILLDFYPRPSQSRPYDVTTTIANTIRRVLRREPAELGDWLDPHYSRSFTQDEVTSELAEGGFNAVHYKAAGYGYAVGRAVWHRSGATSLSYGSDAYGTAMPAFARGNTVINNHTGQGGHGNTTQVAQSCSTNVDSCTIV